jgi:hypothetical protein
MSAEKGRALEFSNWEDLHVLALGLDLAVKNACRSIGTRDPYMYWRHGWILP